MANSLRNSDSEFVRHRGPVTCVAGIPGINAAVSSAYDGAVAYVDLENRAMELLGYHDHLANRVTVNPSGTIAASASSDYSIYLWDLKERRLKTVLLGHWDDVEDFAFADDHTGVSVSRDWRILVWDLDSGVIKRIIEGHEKDVLSVVCSGEYIYTSGDDMTLRVWELETGKLVKMWGPFENETDSCAIDAIRRRAVLGCDDGVIRVFDIDTSETVAEIPAHASGIKKVATSPVNGDILSAAYDQKILVWSSEDFSQKVDLERKATTWERSFNWTPDGQRILAGTFDGTALVWDAVSGKCMDEVGQRENGNPCLNDITANKEGKIVTVSDDGYIRIGSLTRTEANWTAQVEPQAGRMLANAITLDDTYGCVISGAHDQKLHLFRQTDDGIDNEIELHLGEGPINCVRVSHHAGHEGNVFVACYSGAIVQVDPQGKLVKSARIHEGAVKALRLHPTKPLGVSCSADGSLLSWDFQGNQLTKYPGHMAIVDDLDIDPTGSKVVSVSRDFTAKVYDLESGKLLQSFSLGRRSPKAVCFLDPQTVIVTNYWGALIRINLETEDVLTRCIAHNGISSIARCGDCVVVPSYDGVAYLVQPEDLAVVNTLHCMKQRLYPSETIQPDDSSSVMSAS
ncbi:MAG: WD40 repeat domain-containing protein [Planctomycetales bacterium]|nr:WD40 repeat domain-containing protein [Planctomycetales bacterium]